MQRVRQIRVDVHQLIAVLLLLLSAACQPSPASAPLAAPSPAVTAQSQNVSASPCPAPPAATPPWPASPLPSPKLPPRSAVMFTYRDQTVSCLSVVDAQGIGALSAIVSPVDVWRFDARARVLWVLARGLDGRSQSLYWNHPLADGASERLEIAPERELTGFVFSPDGRDLWYVEQDRLDVPRSFVVTWQLIRLDIAAKQKRVVLSGQYNVATPQASRPFSGDMTKVPFGWSEATGLLYLVEPGLGGNTYGRALWNIKPDGSELRQFSTDTRIVRPVLSPDGMHVAYLTIDPAAPTHTIDATFPSPPNQLKIRDAATGTTIVDLSERGDGIFGDRQIVWTSDSRSLLLGRSRALEGAPISSIPSEWLIVNAQDASAKTWLKLDGARDEFVDDLAVCASGEVLYAVNHERRTTDLVLDDLHGRARALATVPGSWGTTRLVGCFK
jgi:hypothetical protein